MQATVGIDSNIFYYEDDNLYFEINVSFKKYGEERSLNMQFDCQGKQGEDLFPLVFIEKKEIYNAEDLKNTIINAILFVNNVSEWDISPFENEKIEEFTQNMIAVYNI